MLSLLLLSVAGIGLSITGGYQNEPLQTFWIVNMKEYIQKLARVQDDMKYNEFVLSLASYIISNTPELSQKKIRDILDNIDIALFKSNPLSVIFSQISEQKRMKLLYLYMSDTNQEWNLINQHDMSAGTEYYTGCWFDHIIISILNYNPAIKKRFFEKYGINFNMNYTYKDYISLCRDAIFTDLRKRVQTEKRYQKYILCIDLVISMTGKLKTNNTHNFTDFENMVNDELLNFTGVSLGTNMYSQLYQRSLLTGNICTIVDSLFKKFGSFLEDSMLEYIPRLYEQKYHLYFLTSSGFITQLSNLILSDMLDINIINITLVMNTDELQTQCYNALWKLSKADSETSYLLFYPLMSIHSICQAPSQSSYNSADESTIFSFTMNNPKSTGHAAIITNKKFQYFVYETIYN